MLFLVVDEDVKSDISVVKRICTHIASLVCRFLKVQLAHKHGLALACVNPVASGPLASAE